MKKILLVDDDPNILSALQRQLRKQFELVTATSVREGLAIITSNKESIAVVVADMNMPEMNGIKFLQIVRDQSPDISRIMLTGNADQRTAMDAINEGYIFRFLTKPCPPDRMAQTLEAGLIQHQLVTAERELLEKTLSGSIKVLTDILAMFEPDSFGQAQSLRDNMRSVARFLGVRQTWEYEAAAMLANIGFVSVPPVVMLKQRVGQTLSGPEFDMLNRVPLVSADLLANIPRLEETARMVRYHRKNYDGSGFPHDMIAGEEIPMGARLLRILSDLAALEARGYARVAALEQLRSRRGLYDARLLQQAYDCLAPEAQRAPGVLKKVAVEMKELRIGQVLVNGIETVDGMMLVAAGIELTPAHMERLKNFSTLAPIREPIFIEG
ncbi:MAG: response regulator [Verrucomicrobia bacterium]|nr:response regulator [Verrucomicrobiota bacterium]